MSDKKTDKLMIASIGILVLLVGISIIVSYKSTEIPAVPKPGDLFDTNKASLETFSSCQELEQAIEERGTSHGLYRGEIMPVEEAVTGASDSTGYSETNVQVAGVDESDITKTDGEYIYTISNSDVVIAKAYPADNLDLVSKIEYDNFSPYQMFIQGNKLVVFGYGHEGMKNKLAPYPEIYQNWRFTSVKIYDISQKEFPGLLSKYDFQGEFVTGRKVEDNIYFVINSYPKRDYPVPLARENEGEFDNSVQCSEIHILDPESPVSYLTLAQLDLNTLNLEKEVIAGNADSVYASKENLYVAQRDYSWNPDPEVGYSQRTNIFKFSLNGMDYKGKNDVPGTVLNQFSMDEHNTFFRIAVTLGYVGNSENRLYVFDNNLNLASSIEDIAPGETIRSARFIGDRAYLVTFKNTDPFFVIDLENPYTPEILGYLKIPGYSNYLHPYDENHIIGIGKDTIEEDENFAWYQGLKLAVFDVTDVENPVEMHKEIIGDRGTDSEVLRDHKAFLFDREKNLLVLPVKVAEIKDKETAEEWTRGDTVFTGAYVYDLTLYGGFNLRGKISHGESYTDRIRRSLYIEDVLYTVSKEKIKANNLHTLKEITMLSLEESLISGCAGVSLEYTQECCDKWAEQNGIMVPMCVGQWEIKNNQCAWECSGV